MVSGLDPPLCPLPFPALAFPLVLIPPSSCPTAARPSGKPYREKKTEGKQPRPADPRGMFWGAGGGGRARGYAPFRVLMPFRRLFLIPYSYPVHKG